MNNLNPIPPEVLEPQRLQSLQSTKLLDSPPEKAFDDLTELVARLLGSPVALVSLVDSNRQFFKSSCGLSEPWASRRQTKLSHSFCKHVVATREALVVNSAPKHPLVRHNLAIRDLGVMAYLGMPLRTPDQEVIGSLCAIDGKARTWSEDDIEILRVLADAVTNEIAVRIYIEQIESFTSMLLEDNDKLERDASELRLLCARIASTKARVSRESPAGPRRAANG